jgi:arsenate reductase
MAEKPAILFLCAGNACRSQMAEGFCRQLRGDDYEVASAGSETHGLNPLAVVVMAELGIDISDHYSKTCESLGDANFDYVITVCDTASDACPYYPASKSRIHRGFDDPPALADKASSEEEILGHYRRVRDEIREYILGLDF